MRIVIFFLLLPFFSCATDYYVKIDGNDALSGRSDATAWATLSKINSFAFSPGDNIYFKRGHTFRGVFIVSTSGNADSWITYSAYGTGAKPKILGSKDMSSTNDWVLYSNNVWKTKSTIGDGRVSWKIDVGNLIFNNETGWGIKKETFEELTAQGTYYLNTLVDTLYMYSARNPGSFYTNIEVSGVYSENLITAIGKNYFAITNIDARYSGNNGIFISNCDHAIVDSCNISWIGGWWFSYVSPKVGPGRMGNGVQIWETNSNITVSNNNIYQIYDAGVSPQGNPTGFTQSNINIYQNYISYCYYSYELPMRSPNTFTNILFDNNTCVYTGYQWSQSQRSSSGDAENIRQIISTGTISGCGIRNNIFSDDLIRHCQMDVTSGIAVDYNLIYNAPAYKFKGTNYTSFEAWKMASGVDKNSLNTNPLFVSVFDYRLKAGSPAINAGIDIGRGAAPNIGAYSGAGVIGSGF